VVIHRRTIGPDADRVGAGSGCGRARAGRRILSTHLVEECPMTMRRFLAAAGAAMVLGWLSTAPARADRPAEDILKDLEAVKMPEIPAKRDQDSIRKYITERQEALEKRGTLIFELYKAAPDNPRVPELLGERWANLPPIGPQAAEVTKEIDEVLAKTDNAKLKVEGNFVKARNTLMANRQDAAAALPAVEAFGKLAPDDQRAPLLFYQVAMGVQDAAKKAEIEDRILKDYPDSRYAGMIQGDRRKREAVGKPFELEFTDAIKETTVSMKGLKGKVVVVDFWATWCGPCVAEMPKMKELYAKYKDQGVEFIGVSLDQPKEEGGLDKLKEFVAKNEIGWPQYYQGAGWESEFSGGWGINAIPCVFVVDPEGKLHSTEARGKLETLIPELLEKKKAADAGGGE
jgi:thiol-disulfide isomerase/thioredoxin